jgi:hypothetical protein
VVAPHRQLLDVGHRLAGLGGDLAGARLWSRRSMAVKFLPAGPARDFIAM